MIGGDMRIAAVLVFALLPLAAHGGSYTIPNSFTTGTTAVASEVNANFSAAKTAIDDNDSRTTTLEAFHAPAATPEIILDDTVATDSNPEALIRGNAVSDDNGRIELMVEDNSDGTYSSGVIVQSTAGTTLVKLGAGSIAGSNFVQIAEGGAMTAQGSASITATAVAANSVALSTGTTGNYVATIADSGASEVTVSGSGSEGAAVTLAIASSITRDSELSAYTISTSDPVDGSDACADGDQWLNKSGQTIFFCVDGSTDDWWGVNLSDAP